MARYRYKGVDGKGKAVRGVREADSPRALRNALRREGVLATDVRDAIAREKQSKGFDIGSMLRSVSSVDLAVATRQLATLLRAGIPLVESLAALRDQSENQLFQETLSQVRDKVNEGISFADALSEHPKVFNDLYINMVRAGEASGTLESVLARLADFMENQNRLKGKVQGALFYPGAIATLTVAVTFFLLTVVVPQVSAIFENFGKVLPWYTRALMATSSFLTTFWWLAILLAVSSVVLFRRWKNSEKGEAVWHRTLLRVPVVKGLVTMVAVSRFTRTLATLLRSGVPVLGAMDITRRVLGNVELMRVIEEARASVREGESIAEPLKRSGRFPPIVTHMIAIGERSGELEQMLEHVSNAYDDQVEAQLTALTSLLEPILLVAMGGVLVVIVFSIISPLLQINEFIS